MDEKEKYLKEMNEWAIDNGLYNEFQVQVVCDEHYEKWSTENLVRRFGYFVLENRPQHQR